MVWLAAGNLNGLSIEKCHALKGRDVMLYPDLGAFEKWNEKAQMPNSFSPSKSQKVQFLSPNGERNSKGIEVREGSGVRCKVTVSTLLEDEATNTDRANGLDIVECILLNNIKLCVLDNYILFLSCFVKIAINKTIVDNDPYVLI